MAWGNATDANTRTQTATTTVSQARLPARRPNLHGSPEFRLRSPGGRCLPLGGSQRGSPAAKSSELAEQFHRGHYHASKSSNTRGSEAGSASPPGGHTFRIAGMAGRSIERLPNHIRCRKCRAGTFQSRARCAPSDCHRPNERIAQQLPALPCGPCESRRRETPPRRGRAVTTRVTWENEELYAWGAG